MENINITERDIKNKITEIVQIQGEVFSELLNTVSSVQSYFQIIDKGIFRLIDTSIEHTYNPLVDENGQRKNNTTPIRKN